jgi:hypothetical protein
VGFSENKTDTINKILKHVDYFVQIRTLYKAPLRLHTLGLTNVKAIKFSEYYDSEDVNAIKKLYVPPEVKVLGKSERVQNASRFIPCGEAIVYL